MNKTRILIINWVHSRMKTNLISSKYELSNKHKSNKNNNQ